MKRHHDPINILEHVNVISTLKPDDTVNVLSITYMTYAVMSVIYLQLY